MASNNGKIPIIATKTIGRYKPDDRITIEKYAARVLVATGKARFENGEDEFRKLRQTKEEQPSEPETSSEDHNESESSDDDQTSENGREHKRRGRRTYHRRDMVPEDNPQ